MRQAGRGAALRGALAALALCIAFGSRGAPAQAAGAITVEPSGAGPMHFVLDRQDFVPIGVNYLVQNKGAPYQTFNMFDVASFDRGKVDGDFKAIAGDGFNYVRLWLKGLDPDTGFGRGPFEIGEGYVDNIVAALRSARSHRLRVVLTGAFRQGVWLPRNYLPQTPLPDPGVVGGINRLVLLPEMARSTGAFFHDLLAAIEAREPALLQTIFYLDLYNELAFDMRQPPFSRQSGQYVFGGTAYDLGNAASRQALMDKAARDWFATVSQRVRSVAPGMLLTASSFYTAAFGHTGFDGGLPGQGAPGLYPLRPAAIVTAGADLIDIHSYPSPAGHGRPAFHERLASLLRGNGVDAATAMRVPVIAGEFGATKSRFSDPAGAVAELTSTREEFCRLPVSGFAVWMWSGGGDSWTLAEQPLLKALAPKYNPTFCKHPVEQD